MNQTLIAYSSLGRATDVNSCRMRGSGRPFKAMAKCLICSTYAVPLPMVYMMCWRQLRRSSMMTPRTLWVGVGLVVVPLTFMGMWSSSFVVVHEKSINANLLVSNFEL